MAQKARISGVKLWIFRGTAILLPFVLIALVEIGFRIAGVATPESLFREVKFGSIHKFQTNPRVAERDFPPELARIMPAPGFQAFDAIKPEGRLRVFCLGASTTAGFPFPAHLSYPALLNEKLSIYLPTKGIEVINCGISAVASFTIVDFTREVLRQGPDLVVIYTGHNEYYGAWGAASSAGPGGSSSRLLPFMRWVQHSRIWRYLSSKTREPDIAPGTLMERMVARPEIDPRSPLSLRAEKDYRNNLRKMIKACKRYDVPVVFCEPVSNLSGHYPFGSLLENDPTLVQSRREKLWGLEKGYLEGRVSAVDVSSYWRALVAEDSTGADLWYHGGWLTAVAGDTTASVEAYTLARDWDTVRFRADSRLLNILRTICRDEEVPLVPLTAQFQAATRGPAPGGDLFMEHLHPGFIGQLIIAESICGKLEEIGWPDPGIQWQDSDEFSARELLQMAGLTQLDALHADLHVAHLLTRWPYAHPQGLNVSPSQAVLEADPMRQYRVPSAYREAYAIWNAGKPADTETAGFEESIGWPELPDTMALRLAQMVIKKDLSILDGHVALGNYYRERGELAKAFVEFRAAARLFPVDPDNYIRAGNTLLKAGYRERARDYLLEALSLSPGRKDVMAVVADCDVEAGRLEEARIWIDRILAVEPGNPQAMALLQKMRERTRESGGPEGR
ncbi:MAG: tetratricopeptide repeat protein [Candidatus Eisenbacteria bacterium]|uniref:Tetratricopeptide repeat protein n=1 Tax=Eiseniibacteriota bacterium TaxID=2212470 RepID=A0A948RYA4_UNCEI|nr:tetratricopeptide repeat protein [Candidatus Eisenbacteria bacterium]MBU2691802.1 tetratricopeptide repeat protein [Candidatus Eisenbacteria bacterium]